MRILSHGHNEVLESPCLTNFQHVIKLYDPEERKPLKVAELQFEESFTKPEFHSKNISKSCIE